MFIKHDFILLSSSIFICYMYTQNAVYMCEFVMNLCLGQFFKYIQMIFLCEDLGCFTSKKTFTGK